MSIPNKKQNITTKSNINTDNNINFMDEAFKSENFLTILKVENVSLNTELKKLNDMVSKLKIQLSNNNAEKIILLQNSSKKEMEIKSLKEKLSIAKNELSSLKQKVELNDISNLKNIPELQSQNEELIKNREITQNHLITLQNKITDLEYELKQQESPSSNRNFNSLLKKSKNISLVLPSLPRYNSSSDLFLTEKEGENQIDFLKQQISIKENEKNKIENELQKIIRERNKLILLLKEKNEEINNKFNLQNKLNNELLEQIDKNKIYKSGYKEAKLKNQILERDKKQLENVVFLQEGKVLQMSASMDKINQMLEVKNMEISKNQKNIQNLEQIIKDFHKKFKNLKNKEKESKTINNMKKQIDNLQNEYKKKLIINQSMQNKNLIGINNINNINYFLKNSAKSKSKIKIINNRYKLLENINKSDKAMCLSGKRKKKFSEKNKIAQKFQKHILTDISKNLGLYEDKKIKNNEYNSNATENNDIELINNKLNLNTNNPNNILNKINVVKKLPLLYSLPPSRNKLKMNYNEENEKKDKENVEEFKLYLNQLISNMEKD